MTRHEAEKAFVAALQKVYRGVDRLQDQVRRDALMLDEIRARLGFAPALERKLTRYLAAMRKKFPDLLKDER